MSKNAAERGLIGNNISKLRIPAGVTGSWKNFSDLENPIAANYDLGDDYDPDESDIGTDDFIVYSDYEYDGKKNSHKSFGYLRSEQFTKEVFEFLTNKEEKPVDRIRTRIKKSGMEYYLSFRVDLYRSVQKYQQIECGLSGDQFQYFFY